MDISKGNTFTLHCYRTTFRTLSKTCFVLHDEAQYVYVFVLRAHLLRRYTILNLVTKNMYLCGTLLVEQMDDRAREFSSGDRIREEIAWTDHPQGGSTTW